MLVTECLHNKCLNCQPCVQFIFSPGCESDMILSVMTLETPTSPLDENPPLTELKPVDPEIFAPPLPRKRKRRNNSPTTSDPPEKHTTNIIYRRPPTPIPTFIQPPPQADDSPVRPLLLVQPVHIPAGKGAKSPPSLLQLIVSPTPDLLHKLKTSRIAYVTSSKRSHEQTLL